MAGVVEERPREHGGDPQELLDRVAVWAREDLGFDEETADERVEIETAIVGLDRYLFHPGDYAAVLAEYAAEHGLGRVVVDPEYAPLGRAPMLQPLGFELRQTGLAVEEAPVERPVRRPALVRPGGAVQFGTVFAASFLFYLLIGGGVGSFDVATGALSGLIVAALFYRVVITQPPDLAAWARQVVRFAVYVPYLFWEIAKANVELAYVILHPSLPIDPEMVHFDAAVWGDLPVTTLANSITLTPGTLTVDVSEHEFHVHSLTGSARRGLLGGSLERGVRFVFYGRDAMRIPGPADRRDRARADAEAGDAAAGDDGENDDAARGDGTVDDAAGGAEAPDDAARDGGAVDDAAGGTEAPDDATGGDGAVDGTGSGADENGRRGDGR